MVGSWTLGRRIGAGFALVVLLAVVGGVVAVVALRNVVAMKDHVISVDAQLLIDAARLQGQLERNGGANRGYLLTGDERFLETEKQAHTEFGATLDALKKNAVTEEGRRLLDTIGRGELEHEAAAEKLMAQRRAGVSAEKLYALFKSDVYPLREALDSQITSFVDREKNILESGRKESSAEASSAINIVTAIALVAAIAAALLAALLTRSLTREIGASVAQAQTSSAELQAASNQQATGAREQATALNEITTTIRELLATSRQITESAGQVARIAEETARAARAGDGTVKRAHESVSTIRKQVDVIVAHMLELGKKSHQIGSVLEIVSELAEQTNILAINATIEAAGAGEAGRRFSIVADEIRKLSDRVASSAKEIRTLIEDVRGSVNTTVMATESGSKAVDAGSREFDDVASAFTRISDLVATTTQAAREIQLSTKQQSTAVEQVDIAIANVAQAAKEAEASSGQVLETASLVAGISRGLARLVHPGTGQT